MTHSCDSKVKRISLGPAAPLWAGVFLWARKR
jgi:hypothetical protein